MNAASTTPHGFSRLALFEPRLLDLERRARDPNGPYFGDERWYGSKGWAARGETPLVQELKHLVGWFAENPQVQTSMAYETAYFHLYALVPEAPL